MGTYLSSVAEGQTKGPPWRKDGGEGEEQLQAEAAAGRSWGKKKVAQERGEGRMDRVSGGETRARRSVTAGARCWGPADSEPAWHAGVAATSPNVVYL